MTGSGQCWPDPWGSVCEEGGRADNAHSIDIKYICTVDAKT